MSSDAASTSKMNQSFPTWSFDKPCTEMEWNEIREVNLVVNDGEVAVSGTKELEESDLILIGVYAPTPPKKEEEEKGKEDEDEDKEEEGVSNLSGVAKEIDETLLGGALSEMIVENVKAFKNGASAGSVTPTLRVVVNGKTRRYAAVGLGKEESADAKEEGEKKEDDEDSEAKKKSQEQELASALGKAIITKCDSEKKVTSCSLLLPPTSVPSAISIKDFYQYVSISFYTALYSDNRFRTKSSKVIIAENLQQVTILAPGAASAEAASGISNGKITTLGVYLSKDIVNAPHNVLNSVGVANTAKRIVKECINNKFTCTVLGAAECEERGMGAYLAVARGSETPPQFIHLKYSNGDKIEKRVGFVGKGVMFDTGGYNIKTAMMELMKFDCGGAAAVLGAARILSQIPEEGGLLPQNIEINFIVAACENMVNDKAYVPSDILTASNGKTIEVVNTDAEGRLTLADAIIYADDGECKCNTIVELSTLTGSMIIALGTHVAGYFTNNEKLAKQIKEAGESSDEKLWRLPLVKEYNEHLKSKIADIKHLGIRYGGSITAALFLNNFIKDHEKTAFAHVDVAGPCWNWTGGTATGYGPKFIMQFIHDYNNQQEQK